MSTTQPKTFLYSQHHCEGRVLIKDLLSIQEDSSTFIGASITVSGWVKTGRLQAKGTFAFVHLSDGTTVKTLQIIIDKELGDLKSLVAVGTAISVRGLIVPSQGDNQRIELKATEIIYIGECDPSIFPLAKKAHSVEYLRSIAHLRPRSKLVTIRNSLSIATHTYFQNRNFIYAHTPILTGSDCEGAGEMFQVTSLLPTIDTKVPDVSMISEDELISLRNKITETTRSIASLKLENDQKEEIDNLIKELQLSKEQLKQSESKNILLGGIPFTRERKLDYTKDFFGVPAHLTVSGQLQAETFACALSNTYTFGPTFRAEESLTSRHLAEFWMIEPEVAFADLFDVMQLAEDYVKFCCEFVLQKNLEDLEFIDQWQEQETAKNKDKDAKKRQFTDRAVERVSKIIRSPFKRISYTEAIDLLLQSGKTFETPVSWGMDLSSEHERFLAESIFNAPTIVYNYPKDIKAFYMRQNPDGKTVAAMDILVPQIGELIGGSQREERFQVLSDRINEMGLNQEDFWWYLELRKFGTAIHSGFGLGFERLIMFVTGMENIRDVIPFPRSFHSIAF